MHLVVCHIHTAAILTVVVMISCSAQPAIDPDMIVDFMNGVRANVQTPPASNMRLMVRDVDSLLSKCII